MKRSEPAALGRLIYDVIVEQGRAMQQLNGFGRHYDVFRIAPHGGRSREDQKRPEHLAALEIFAENLAGRRVAEARVQGSSDAVDIVGIGRR